MDRTPTPQWNIPEGTDIFGSEGDKIGKVIGVYPNHVVVEKGFFFPTDYYVPVGAIANYDGNRAYLNVTKDEALNSGWDVAPADTATTYDASGTGTYAGLREEMGASAAADVTAGSAAAFGTTGHMGESATSPGLGGELTAEQRRTTERAAGEDVTRVPVYEEELTATKRPVEQGQVRVEKDVVTEQRAMDVPVSEERVRVTRQAVDRPADAAADAFQEETLEVPLRGEAVDVQKRVRQTEEVDVAKERVQKTQRVTGDVRREEVHVEDQSISGAEIDRDASNPL